MNAILKQPLRPIYHMMTAVPMLRERARRAAIGSDYRRWCADNPCPESASRFALYQSLLDAERLGEAIDYLEFGVWKGESLRWWIENNRDPASSFFGFDSFEGLPVNWEGMPRGSFSVDGALPEIDDPRCRLVKGLFQDTLPPWLSGRELSRRLVVNLDADLYGSTLLAMIQLMPRMKPGDVLIFDEFHSYMHEFRALQDALDAYPMRVAAIGRSGGWGQVALKVISSRP